MVGLNEQDGQILQDLNTYALELKKARKFNTSEIVLNRCLKMDPDSGVLWMNLGAVLWNLNRFDEAEYAFKRSIANDYKSENVWNNLGLLYASMQRWDESIQAFNKADEINPKNHMAKWERALCLLDKGDWSNGLPEYEIRRDAKPLEFGKLKYPLWDGKADLNGKTIFIQAEQGIGDRILFTRYLHWLKKKYPDVKIKYLCDSTLHGLLWELKQECDIEYIPNRVPWPEADYGCWLMSLPMHHGTTPDNVYPDPGLVRKRIDPIVDACNLPVPEGNMLKVGICWTGNDVMAQNIQRSIPLEQMLLLAEDPNILLYNLQVGEKAYELHQLGANQLVCDIGPEMHKEGWVGTAQVIMNLDLVITCCTSIAHLAGALNKPCWVLLCYAPYWIWLRGREDSPWYPSVRLFRQQKPGEWPDLINNVKEELSKVVKSKGV